MKFEGIPCIKVEHQHKCSLHQIKPSERNSKSINQNAFVFLKRLKINFIGSSLLCLSILNEAYVNYVPDI